MIFGFQRILIFNLKNYFLLSISTKLKMFNFEFLFKEFVFYFWKPCSLNAFIPCQKDL